MRLRVEKAVRTVPLLFGLMTGMSGCGTLGDGVPPVDDWPRTPLRGFVLRDQESPFVLLRAGFDLDMPTVEPRKMGASLHIYGQMSPRNQPERSQLFSTEVTNLGEESEPQEILSPMLPWEGQGIANPVWLTDLPNLEPLLLYTSIDGAIGVFRRVANGSLERLSQPLAAAKTLSTGKLGRVSPTVENGRVRLYFTVDDWSVRYAEADAAAVAAFVRNDSQPVRFVVSPSLLTAADFLVSITRSQEQTADRLSGLFVRRVTTPAGRSRYDLYARAEAMGKAVLVAASSYRGDSSDPFRVVPDALLAATAGGVPMGPSVSEQNGHTLLLLGLKTVQAGIAVAVPQADLPKKP